MKPGPREIIGRAIAEYAPIAIYVGYSGGNDSLRVTHWSMTNVPGCEVFHVNTGIGIERTRTHVRETCFKFGWPLHELRATDCGQSYEALVLEFGFPGPDGHNMMYSRLKERAIRTLIARSKIGRSRYSKVMLISGLQHGDSARRMRYAGREINRVGAQLWVNPFYWSSKAERDAYIALHKLPINPVTLELGMSGECGCGAFAQPGELARWRKVDPSFGERIDNLSQGALANGFTWGWEGHPPAGGHNPNQMDAFLPLCGSSCYKSALVRDEEAETES